MSTLLYRYNKSIWLIVVLVFVFFALREYLRSECVRECPSEPTVLPNKRASEAFEGGNKRPILGFLSYTAEQKRRLKALVLRKAPALDQELVAYVKEVMDEPAPRDQIKMSRSLFQTPQASEIDKILRKKENGFFIEAGGLDGERSSNTIFFEKTRGWTGLLVEPDPYFYTQLMGKNRASWSINACISPLTHVSELPFSMSLVGKGQLDLKSTEGGQFKVPCYPLETLLAALSVTHVDFFSLDIEGAEGIVLESVPFDKLDISTLAVEYAHGSRISYMELMKSKGYNMTKEIRYSNPAEYLWVEDFIFVKGSLVVPNTE